MDRRSLERAVKGAVAVASLTVLRAGAQPSYPSRGYVLHLLDVEEPPSGVA